MDLDATIHLRINAANAALKRRRVVLALSTAMSVWILISVFGAYRAWRADVALQEEAFQRAGPGMGDAQRSQWVNNTSITMRMQLYVSVFGLNLRVTHAPIPVAGILLALSGWLFVSARRENHVLGHLLRDTRKAGARTREAVLQGVASSLLLTPVPHRDDTPVTDIERDIRDAAPPLSLGLGKSTDLPRARLSTRLVLAVLAYLPVITVVLTVAFVLALIASQAYAWTLYPPLGTTYPTGGAFDAVVALALGVAVFLACRRSARLGAATTSVLQQYARTLEGAPLSDDSAGHPDDDAGGGSTTDAGLAPETHTNMAPVIVNASSPPGDHEG